MITQMEFETLSPTVLTTLNVPFAYVPGFYGGGTNALVMHIVYPANAPEGGCPVLLWICGGGWECCEPERRLHDLSYFAERGYIVCLAEYRISAIAPFPAQIIDVKTAIRFIRLHAAQFRADPDRIALMGDSAGGHLVALAGLTPDLSAFSSGQWAGATDAVQAVVDWYGVIDFDLLLESYGCKEKQDISPTDCLVKLFGGYPQDKPELVALASPLCRIIPSAPPFLILHGDQDRVVPFEQSQLLHDRLTEAGVPCELVIVKGADHATAEFSQKKLLGYVADWLDRVL